MMERTIRTESMDDVLEILRGVRLLNPLSDFDGIVDVAVGPNSIQWIRETSAEPSGHWLIPGLVDMHVHLRYPGYEEAEILETGLRAAIAGGVTVVGMMPNTTPPLDSLESVRDVLKKASLLELARIEPIPCVTVERKGIECVNLESFAEAGITCFSDDGSPVESDLALQNAFLRTAVFNGVIIEHPEVTSIASGGAVNLGAASLATGASGIPESAEYLDVKRCIDILRNSKSTASLHLTHLSSPESIQKAFQAASEGLKVTCDVTPHHLALNEEDVVEKGSVAKMNPPLRSEESRKMVVDMIRRGMVTAIASDHAPHPESKKKLPLSSAAFGITGLETLLSVTSDVLTREAGMQPLEIIRLLTTSPAAVLNCTVPEISVGKTLNMVLFDPLENWRYSRTNSRSTNSPFFGEKLTGKILRVWFGRELYREGEFV